MEMYLGKFRYAGRSSQKQKFIGGFHVNLYQFQTIPRNCGMFNLLVVAATPFEIAPTAEWLKKHGKETQTSAPTSWRLTNEVEVTLLITGVGIHAATYSLTKMLQSYKFGFVLQVGVGGTFDTDIPLGSICFIKKDCFGDLGAEDHEKELDLFDIGLLEPNTPPYTDGWLVNSLESDEQGLHLSPCKGLTVNTVSGSENTIAHRKAKFGADVESMEGAAFHYVCLNEQVQNFAQVRAISNYVVPRDKNTWKMAEAINNLNIWLKDYIAGFERA